MSRETNSRVIARSAHLVSVSVLVVASMALVGCSLFGGGVSPVEVPTTPVGIVGEIKSVEFSDGGEIIATMLVEGGEQPAGAVSDKAMVTVTTDTNVAQGDRWVPAQDLAVGMTVRVWFDGAVAESYPVQGSASFIEVQ